MLIYFIAGRKVYLHFIAHWARVHTKNHTLQKILLSFIVAENNTAFHTPCIVWVLVWQMSTLKVEGSWCQEGNLPGWYLDEENSDCWGRTYRDADDKQIQISRPVPCSFSLSFGLCFLSFSSVNSSISRTINRFCSVKITAQRGRKQVLFPLPHCRCYTSYGVHASKSDYTMSGCESTRRETKTKRQAPWMVRNTALIHQLPPFQNQTNQPVDK